MPERAVRIANCAGWLWDRFSGLRDALAGPVDVVSGDYLAEPTLRQLALERAGDPSLGYARSFLAQFTDAVDLLAERGARLVVDAGGLNPAGLADEVRRVIADAGLELTVAHVEGDDLSARLEHLGALEHLDTGVPLAASGLAPTTANAYLGGWGIAAALAGGADVVVCPRVTDASLTVGAAAWWHGWGLEDWDRLAGAVAAAHVIECGPQATGGNFSGFTTVPRVDDLGYPIAEVAANGTAVITKHEVAGGTVTTDTVTAQLLYEIQGPTYLNPDVTVHLDDVALTQVAPDRVEITGVTGSPPPPTTKLAMTAPGGYETSVAFYATGLDLDAKVALLRTHVDRITAGLDLSLLRIDRLGVPVDDPPDQWAAAQQILVTAQSRTKSQVDAQHFVAPMTGLFLPGYPGLYVTPLKVCAPVVEYWPALVGVDELDHVVVTADGTRTPVAETPQRAPFAGQRPSDPAPDPPDLGPTRRVPLGLVAHGRCGDKGGNSNVGLWIGAGADERAWPWLAATLTTARLRALFPDAADVAVERHVFPTLRAVHFVVHDVLGKGASSNGRPDIAGKAVAEFLRARHLEVPECLL
ncbi:acyclic terpene utilization AtuA family protein [Actinomycetospora sp. CA-101289]|uniref:acyclic terpene utilization AtuA family protein n=1 Tax=Actinomycetospora sp. CA-101289 TaxID=3239893 RepID=UPI003D99999C